MSNITSTARCHNLARRALARGIILLALSGLVAGCSTTPIATLPSGSGTLANAAGAPTAKPRKPFNPFVEDDDAGAGRRFVIDKPTIAQVMQPGPLPEHSIGRADAPVTIIKYASMTCPYCRQFHLKTFPQLKKNYVDTGKVRFILREFPIGFQSGAATIALRCVPSRHYFAAYGALMRGQSKWVSQQVRREPIWTIVRKFDLTREKFDTCYKDETLVANLNAIKNRGRTLGVIGTPNFFVNGKLYKRVLTMTDFDRIISRATQTATASN